MKRALLSPVLLLFLTVFPLWGMDFHASSQVFQGDVLTLLLTGCAEDYTARFILTDPEGKTRSVIQAVPLEDEELPPRTCIGLMGIDSALPSGTYTVRAEIERPLGALEFERPLLVRGKTFKTEDIPLNQAMSDLRTTDDPEKLEQSRRLWTILTRVGPGSVSPGSAMLSPVEEYIMTSWFGDRRQFLYTDGGNAGSIHTGADMAADTGTPISAPLEGTVVLAEERILTGYSIVLEHSPGIYTLYYHLDTLEVSLGDRVSPGDPLGTLGSTGLVTGPHLHWELRINTIPVDPMRYLERPLIDKDEIMAMINDTKEEGR